MRHLCETHRGQSVTVTILVVPQMSSPGKLLEMQILEPYLDSLNQKLWEWGPAMCVSASPPEDSEAC